MPGHSHKTVQECQETHTNRTLWYKTGQDCQCKDTKKNRNVQVHTTVKRLCGELTQNGNASTMAQNQAESECNVTGTKRDRNVTGTNRTVLSGFSQFCWRFDPSQPQRDYVSAVNQWQSTSRLLCTNAIKLQNSSK